MNVDKSYVGQLVRRGQLRGQKRGGRLFVERAAARSFKRAATRPRTIAKTTRRRRASVVAMQARSQEPTSARVGILGRIEQDLDDVKAALARIEQFWA